MIKQVISAIVTSDNGSNYFLILHRNSIFGGWEFPKGEITDGESPEQALIRKIKEETSLTKIEVKEKLDLKIIFKNENSLHNFDIYLVEANMNSPVKVKKSVHDNFLWADPSRILELLKSEEERKIFHQFLMGKGD